LSSNISRDLRVRDRQHRRGLERPGHRRAGPVVEHAHLTEQVAGLHQRHDALATVDRIREGDGESAAQHEIQRLGRIALVEEHVASDQMQFVAGRGDTFRASGGIGEEVGAGEGLFVSHDIGHGTTLRRCAQRRAHLDHRGRRGSGQRFGTPKQYECSATPA
jgi:hypothetical protein